MLRDARAAQTRAEQDEVRGLRDAFGLRSTLVLDGTYCRLTVRDFDQYVGRTWSQYSL